MASGIINRTETDRIQAGLWLSENASHADLVAYDFYTYVPPEFARRFHQPYLTAYEVLTVKPDYIVSSTLIMSRYLDIGNAEQYSRGRDMYLKHYYLYSKLSGDLFPGYRKVKDFGEVKIYRKTSSR